MHLRSTQGPWPNYHIVHATLTLLKAPIPPLKKLEELKQPVLKIEKRSENDSGPVTAKNVAEVAKAGHVTDQVSHSKLSRPNKNERVQGEPAGKKRGAEADLEKDNHKRSKNSPEPSGRKRQADTFFGKREHRRQKASGEAGEGRFVTAQKTQGRQKRQTPTGLRNTQNVCYYNAVLQSLLQTGPIRDYCIAKGDRFTDLIGEGSTPETLAHISKHTTRRSMKTQDEVTSSFENVKPEDV